MSEESDSCVVELVLNETGEGGGWSTPSPQPPAPGPALLERYGENGGSGGWGPLARSSSCAFRPRDRPRARTAGTVLLKGAEPAFCAHSDYMWVYMGFLTCTRTAGIWNLHGRPCSRTHRLSCVPEGAPFFAAAATAGARAPLKTIERYAFLKVRRAGAPVPGARKPLIFP